MRSATNIRVAIQTLILSLVAVCAISVQTPAAQATPSQPAISRIAADSVGPTIATLQAQINPNEADTTYRFEYGTTSAYGNGVPTDPTDIGSGASGVPVTTPLTGLQPDTTYHYRVIATNSHGTTTTEDQTFSTFGVASFHVSVTNADNTPDLQAGSAPYQITVAVALPVNKDTSGEPVPAGAIKDQSIELPPGLIGNANALPQCPRTLLTAGKELGASHCPSDTQVGVLTLNTSTGSTFTFPVFNLVPPPGVPAQLAVFALLFPITMNASVGPSSNYGTTVTLANLSQLFPTSSTSLTLWGVPADSGHDPYRGSCLSSSGTSNGNCHSDAPPRQFLTLPTECGSPLTIGLQTDSWEQPGDFLTAASTIESTPGTPLNLFGCERLDFNPTITVQPDTTVADAPAGLTIDVATPNQDPGSLATASLKNAEVTLPEGMTINAAAGDGLGACTAAQIELISTSPPSCPDSSQIGTAQVQTPLLPDPLTGAIYLAQPNENPFGGLLAAYVVAEGDGLLIKLPLQFTANPLTGQLTIALGNIPQLPLTDFKLTLHGGPRATLASPAACGTFTTTAQLAPYSAPQSGPPLTGSSSFLLDTGCTGNFAPSFIAGATTASASANTGFTLQLGRENGQQPIHDFTATLPPGLLANLDSVPKCQTSQVTTGSCDHASRIGSATIATGAGSHPLYLPGSVYLTGPYRDAPFGLAIVVPADIGPLNLGMIITRAQVFLAPGDMHLSILSDPLPQIQDGIPLRLRGVNLTIDRPGFLFNPTECGQQAVNSTIESSDGVSVARSTPFQVNGCKALTFTPQLEASTQAHASNLGNGAGIQVTITAHTHSQANLRSLALNLPSGLQPRLTTIQQACRANTFLVNPAACPSGSVVGDATVSTPMLASPLTGPIYLVFRGGKAYPELRLILQGEGTSIELDGLVKISRAKVITTTFATIPDVPINTFTLSLPRGPHSLLGAAGSLCTRSVRIGYTVVGQNGARVKRTTRVGVAGCRTQHAPSRTRARS